MVDCRRCRAAPAERLQFETEAGRALIRMRSHRLAISNGLHQERLEGGEKILEFGPEEKERERLLTQESVVSVGREDLFGAIEEEPEGQENLHVRSFDQHTLVDLRRVLEVTDANGIGTRLIADGVQGIENLKRGKIRRIKFNSSSSFLDRFLFNNSPSIYLQEILYLLRDGDNLGADRFMYSTVDECRGD